MRGFRVDVRDAEVPGPWSSLVQMEGDLSLGAHDLGHFDGEMCVELAPSQFQGERDGVYWLPPYFTQWAGSSLIARHDLAAKLDGRDPAARLLKPKDADDVPLKYGREYDFRVRLVDLTGGGPGPDDPGAGTSCQCDPALPFSGATLPPGRVHMPKPEEEARGQTLVYQIPRPLLGYPTALYTELTNADALLLADQPQAKLRTGQPALPILMWRCCGSMSRSALCSSIRSMSAPASPAAPVHHGARVPRRSECELELRLTFADEPDLAQLPAPTASGDLLIPTAREVYVTLTPVARSGSPIRGERAARSGAGRSIPTWRH